MGSPGGQGAPGSRRGGPGHGNRRMVDLEEELLSTHAPSVPSGCDTLLRHRRGERPPLRGVDPDPPGCAEGRAEAPEGPTIPAVPNGGQGARGTDGRRRGAPSRAASTLPVPRTVYDRRMPTPLGITVPLEGFPLSAHREVFQALERAGYSELWSAEAGGTDGFTPLALGAAWSDHLRLGTAILPVFTRGPGLLAMSIASLAESAPGRLAIGLGSSSDVIVSRWNGIPFDRPYQRVRDTLRFLRAALSGARVDQEFETFSVSGFRLGRVPEVPPPLLLAALRPGMLRLAGREADGVILNWLAAADVPRVLAEVAQGRAAAEHPESGGAAAPPAGLGGGGWTGAAGRTVAGGDAGGAGAVGAGAEGAPGTPPLGSEVVARIFVCVSEDAEAVRRLARFQIAAYLNVPVYAEFHRWLGRGAALQGMWAAWAAGDRRGALDAIPDAVVDELVVHGSPDQCREGIRAYVEAGVTTPVVALLSLGDDQLESASALGAAG